ncbi:MAG: aminotransferase class I/II-fold pyridoxal phosphate-dependent enzyme [Dehalococcoidia bacterium]|nr:aminotransferase class I/II-fold pyridoxal phosphate-dependent enzyme [Dehalococcoidia bacterium]
MRELEGYVSGMPWERIVRDLGFEAGEVAKLDGNENPYGPSPLVERRIADAPINLYPDPDQVAARRAIANYVGVAPENVVGGNGSDELLDLVVRLFCGPGDEAIISTPTFAMYGIYARLQGVSVIDVPRRGGDWSLDVEGIERAWATPNLPHDVYSISTGINYPIGDMLAAFQRHWPGMNYYLAPETEANYVVPIEPPGPRRSTARLEQDFGWKPSTPLDDGVRQYLDWIRKYGPQ